ncbi:MAG: leucyl/phenylalanyl-tRNA--protein transferase [Campylobacterales bacterium]|nr:leucyl/phenylalanyl-tRNA--protein transferase [Campylobacterales bacterium]
MRIIQNHPPVYLLGDEPIFPQITDDFEELIAVGGNFSFERLLNAYQNGIFPWYMEEEIIYWFSPKTRMIIDSDNLKISKSLRKVLNKNTYEVRFNTNFDGVIENCASIKRKHEDDTWIKDPFKIGYKNLHKKGIAKSVETYYEGELVGGLYGLSLGDNFYGESMFAKKSDASKVALVYLANMLQEKTKNSFIDCQISSEHLKRMGGYEISREKYLKLIGVE